MTAPTGVLFAAPQAQPLSASGQLQAGMTATFYLTGTTTPANVYADGDLTTSLGNVVTANSAGTFQAFYLNPAVIYKCVLNTSGGSLIDTIDPMVPPSGATSLTQAAIGAALYPQTAAEIAASVTPSNYYYPATPCDVRRYGWASTNTAAQNTTALAAAISALQQYASKASSTVYLPAGTFALNAVTIPRYVIVQGAGKFGTIITHTNAAGEVVFTLGDSASVNSYGCGLRDLSVQLTGTAGTCVYLQSTVGANVTDVYCEGETISSGRTTYGVVIDAGSISAFYNRINNVECNHLHYGFVQWSTGTEQCTDNFFSAISGTGDVGTDTTSVGIQIGTGSDTAAEGQDSVYVGCDFESYGTGCHFTSTAAPATFVGARFEGNTKDLVYDSGSGPQAWFGSLLPDTITDNTGTLQNQYIGGFNGSNVAVLNKLIQAQLGAVNASDVMLTAFLAASHTGNVLNVKNSSGAIIGGIATAAAQTAPALQPFDVAGISGTGTPALNLRGTAAFSSATTKAVSFGTAEPDASYFVALSGNAAGYCWVTAEGTGGFTINCSSSNSNSVDWILIR